MKRLIIAVFLFFQINIILAQAVVEIAYRSPKNTGCQKLKKQRFDLEKYNQVDQLIEKQRYLYNDDLTEKTTYEYNEKKQVISETDLSAKGEIKNRRDFEYYENGLLKRMSTNWLSKEWGPLKIKEDHFCDEKNNLVKKTWSSNKSGIHRTWTYEYKFENNNKIVTEKDSFRDKKQAGKRFIYNEKGLLIEEKQGYQKWFYEYTFDESGDWITKRVYEKISLAGRKFVGEYRKTKIG